jgi:hypothetical protein
MDPDVQGDGCPSAADIRYYGGLVSKSEIIVSAVSTQDYAAQDLYWHVNIDLLKLKRRITLKATHGRHEFEVQDADSGAILAIFRNPVAAGRDSVELSFDLSVLGLDRAVLDATDLRDSDAVILKLMSEFTSSGTKFCDDTLWFKPTATLNADGHEPAPDD